MPGFKAEEFHQELFEALEAVERGELKRLMVYMPPRSGKSEIISKRFPAWCLGREPDKQIVCASYGAELANEFGRKTKQIVTDSQYQKVFPEFGLADDKREGGHWDTTEGGGYYSIGVGGALTGRGFDIGIIDDPVKDREQAESITIREKVWDWYTSTFFTRQQGSNAAIIVLMTRWNTDDLAGRILEQEADGWKILTFPAIDDDGNPLCTRDGYGLSFYEAQKKAIGVRDFAALYQQDPILSTGATFKKEDFRYFNMSDVKPEKFTFALHVDPAFSTRNDSDDIGIVVTARHKHTNEIYVLDVFAAPLLPSEAYAYILSSLERWQGASWTLNFMSVEEATISKDQQDFLNGLQKYMKDNKKFCTTLLFKPRGQGKKEDRIRFSLEPMFNRHAIYFRSDDTGNTDWVKLEEQLLKFPVNRHDDLIDALSQGVVMWSERSEQRKPRISQPRRAINTVTGKPM